MMAADIMYLAFELRNRTYLQTMGIALQE